LLGELLRISRDPPLKLPTTTSVVIHRKTIRLLQGTESPGEGMLIILADMLLAGIVSTVSRI
jgi:hypothetical protein